MVVTDKCVDDLLETLKSQMYLPTEAQILCLESIRPSRVEEIAWCYELRGYVKALVASGVTSDRTIGWLEERLFVVPDLVCKRA